MPSPEDLMREMFLYLLDPADTDRAFVQFKPSDQVVMLVNNFGGLSNLELDGLTNVAREQLSMLTFSSFLDARKEASRIGS